MSWGLSTYSEIPESLSGAVGSIRFRPGIETRVFGRWTFERCDSHGKEWREGDMWEENGGKACRTCCLNEPITGTARVGDDTYIFRDTSVSRLAQAGTYSQLVVGSTHV